MVSIKLKFRPSSIEGREGSLYYQVIYRRIVRQVTTPYKVLSTEWDAENESLKHSNGSRSSYLVSIRQSIQWEMEHFQHIIRKTELSGKVFSADDIISTFQNQMQEITLFSYMEKQIVKLLSHDQRRTAETYRTTLNSFRRFREGKDLSFKELDTNLLTDYEYYLKKSGITPNSIAFYMKRLRAVYNKAVEDELAEDQNPFRKISTTSEKTIKRAIPLDTIRKLKKLDLSHSPVKRFARDMFLFSFYTRGMSFVDMVLLQKSDLKNGILSYRRKKTGQALNIKWLPCMQKILAEYTSSSLPPYLLPIIRKPEEDISKQCHNTLTLINRHLKDIGWSLGLTLPLTMYVARHSWASIARNEGIPLSVISEGMGHNSERTTRIYLSSLETQLIDKANNKIIGKL